MKQKTKKKTVKKKTLSISKKKKKVVRKKKAASEKKENKLPAALTAVKVFNPCPLSSFSFKTTKQIKPSHEIISQKRAVRAIDMGLGIRKPGYNIYVAGMGGTGKTSIIKSFLERWSKDAPTPDDWIYVHDFSEPEAPKAIPMAAGEGRMFAKSMDGIIKTLKEEIPNALQGEEYENTVNSYISQNGDQKSRMFSELEKLAKTMDFQVKSTRMGIETIPIVDGRPISEKDYNKLSDEERTKIENTRSKLEPEVLDFARKVRAIETETKEYIEKLQAELGKQIVAAATEPVKKKFESISGIGEFLKQVEEHIVDHLLDFVELDDLSSDDEQVGIPASDTRDKFRKYRVNVFIDRTKQNGAPVIIETNPTYYNLFGKIEKNVEHGMYLTDFTMVQAGAFHKANGGYLVLDAIDIFKTPSVWDMLKRVLRNQKGFIEDMGEQYSLLPTSGLRPEPIPLDVKVILIGSNEIYHTLYEADEEFQKIFKIKSDFDYKMPRNRENIKAYVSFIATRAHVEDLLDFDRSGIAAIVEFGSRLVDDQTQLTSQFGEIKDLTIESDYIAREHGSLNVKRRHVEEAIKNKLDRVNLFEDHLMEMIKNEDIMITVDGTRIGQVNGLAVYDLGDHSFGKIGRITCTTSVNDEGIFNIDRASKLSGNIHDKGMYILSGYLNAVLAKEHSLGFSASVCFEQSYGIIDGDSATIAELTAIISAIAGIPVFQNVAMTGSLNQFGDVQAVGGINEKAEGFYRACKLLGKNKKDYTLIIPFQNVQNFMLQKDVREAVKSGYLKIFPVRYFWEAFELATGVPLGTKSISTKTFTRGSALDIIAKKIHQYHTDDKASEHHHVEKKAASQGRDDLAASRKRSLV
ncbi:MAG: ATP-binding protein [Bdellovibrionota bacterium]